MYYQKRWIVQYKNTINNYHGVCNTPTGRQLLVFNSLAAAEQYAAEKQAEKGFSYYYWTTEWTAEKVEV